MPIPLILTFLLIIFLLIASIYDLKTREVPDWLPYTLIPTAFILKLLQSIITKSPNPIIYTTATFAVFWLLSLLLYHARQWGGGDAKMFMAIGAALPTYPTQLLKYLAPNLNLPFPLILIINILIAGSVYGILYFSFIASKNNIKVKLSKKIKILTLMLIAFILALLIISPPLTKPPLLALAVLIALFPYATKLSRIIQTKYLTKTISLSKVTEGDWIARDIYKNKKLLIKKSIPGLALEDIALLKKNNIKTITVRYGIPFVPALLLGTLLTLLIGNLFVF